MKNRSRILAAPLSASAFSWTSYACAQSYPGKTITVSIATAPGSAPDALIE